MKTEDRDAMGLIYEGFGLSPQQEIIGKIGNVANIAKKITILDHNMEEILGGLADRYGKLKEELMKNMESDEAKTNLLMFYKELENLAVKLVQQSPVNQMPQGLPATEFEQEEDMY